MSGGGGGVNCRGVNCRGVNCRGVNCRGVNCRGVNCRPPILLCPKTDIGQTEAVNEKSYAVKFDYTIYNKPFLFNLNFATRNFRPCICWYLPPNPTPLPTKWPKITFFRLLTKFEDLGTFPMKWMDKILWLVKIWVHFLTTRRKTVLDLFCALWYHKREKT